MIPLALGGGALLAALTQLSPWLSALLLLGVRLPGRLRFGALAGFALVLVRIWSLGDPWAGQIGVGQQLEGNIVDGFLKTSRGQVYVRHFPRLEDGYYRLAGHLERPEGRRNPGGFDQRAWLRGLGVGAVFHVEQVVSFRAAKAGLRDGFRRRLEAGLSPAPAALAVALTLGERRDLGEIYNEFQRSGLAHALALSGLNVAILAGCLLVLFYPLGRFRYLAVLAVMLGYLAITGPFPSLVRAVIMAAVALVGLFLGKGKVEVFPLLGWSLLLHLVYEPYAIFSLSFQLSYLAVLGMAVVLPRIPKPRGVWGWVSAAFATTLAAQLFLIPLLVQQFHRLPLVSPLANLFVLPLLNLLVPLGFLKLFLGGLLAVAFEFFAKITLALVRLFAAGPQLAWGEAGVAGSALYFLGVLPLLLALYQKVSWRRAGVLAATAALAAMAPTMVPRAELWQLDVGQGDASLVRLPSGVEILVDGGRDWAAGRVISALWALGIQELDVVVATHPDADHVGGLPQVLREVRVGTLVVGPRKPGDPLDDGLRRAASERHIRVLEAGRGSALQVGGARLDFLGPGAADVARAQAEGDDNYQSLVFVLDWAASSLLFTGDAPQGVEESWRWRKVDVLKVGHHGSARSTGESLLARFQPKVAVIGVGRNPFGHPSAVVLRRLQQHGVVVRRTDLEGAVRIPLR